MWVLLLILILILLNGYFSAAEIAIVSVKKFKMEEEAEKGNKSAKQILQYQHMYALSPEVQAIAEGMLARA